MNDETITVDACKILQHISKHNYIPKNVDPIISDAIYDSKTNTIKFWLNDHKLKDYLNEPSFSIRVEDLISEESINKEDDMKLIIEEEDVVKRLKEILAR